MTLKNSILFSGIIALGFSSCKEQKNTTANLTLSNQMDSVSYSIGVSIGSNISQSFQNDSLNNINIDVLVNAFRNVLKKDSLLIKSELSQAVIQRFMQNRMELKAKAGLEKGKKFLEENAKNTGVVTLPSGLQYQIMKAGTGAKPGLTDTITFHYHGTLTNGTIFDSSVQRGEPVRYVLAQLIPGWIEALQLMHVGSKWKLWIPGNLAYGERGSPPKIGPNETLVFEVELLAIKK